MSYPGYGRPATVVTAPDPVCGPGGAVIAVRATGVCRSDWHAWRGHDPVSLPHIPGHEFAGVVVDIGAGVSRFAVGDRVTAPFVNGCGTCDHCRAGQAQVCPNQVQPGFTGPGSFAQLVGVQAADVNLVRLPAGVDFGTAASLGCRFATAFRAVMTHGRLARDQTMVVFGCGGVGLSALMIGVAVGARVIAVDPSPAARARAAELGAAVTVPGAEALHDVVGDGAHLTVDAIGAPDSVGAAIRSLRRRGRHVQIGLLFGAQAAVAVPMDRVIAYELEIYGSHGMPAVDYPAMLEMVTAGTLRPELLVGRVIGLEDAGRALAAMDGPTPVGMTVIEIPG